MNQHLLTNQKERSGTMLNSAQRFNSAIYTLKVNAFTQAVRENQHSLSNSSKCFVFSPSCLSFTLFLNT